jgi:tRNA-modifying protein YgfZ
MSTDWNLIELTDLGMLRFRGADTVKFLQGQVSNDVERLTAERSQLAGYHNPQGRVIALLRLVQLAPDDVLAILPRELVATVASRLMKFVLRAKVKIADDSAGWRIAGLVAPHAGGAGAGRVRAASSSSAGASGAAVDGSGASDKLSPEAAAAFEARASSWAAAQFQQASAAAATAGELSLAAAQLEEAESVVPLPTASALMLPDAVHSQSLAGGTFIIRIGATPARWLALSPAGEAAPLAGCVAADRDVWRLLDIADGEAQVYAATSEEFVAQMLNLDALDAIAFDKGCYTGQEVIARAHYRGRVKRRLQRLVSRGMVAKLTVGATGQLTDGRAFKVVEAVQLEDGRCEFLAVAPMVAGATPGGTEAISSGADASAQAGSSDGPTASAAPTTSTPVLDAEALPLPYPLPE